MGEEDKLCYKEDEKKISKTAQPLTAIGKERRLL
jgi:hypothetical protein